MNNQPLTNPSPKQRFQAVPANIHKHREMVDSEAFTRGADAAMIQYQAQLSMTGSDRDAAAAMGYKLQGALEFLLTFRMISETPKLAPVQPVGTLDEKA